MLVGEGPSRPLRTEADLRQLHAEMLDAWQYQRRKGLYSHCLPALLRPSNERSCDERHLVVWCVDHDYKGLGTYFSVLNPEGPGCTTAEVITLFEIDSHYIFDNMFALADAAADNPLEAPLQFEQFAKLWTFSEADGHQFVIESKKASTRHLPKGFALVGAQLKKTAEGRAILSGLDGQEAHHYFSGHRTRHGGKTSRKKARVVPTFSTEEQDARYLGSWVWEDMRRDLCKGGRSVPTHEVLDYIRGPHVPPHAKQKLTEHGVWAEFEDDLEEDGNKISVDHIVPHDWMGTDHPMNYFLLPRSLNSQLHTRGVLADDGRGHKVKVTKKQLVGMSAYTTATSFHRLSLAVEQGLLPVDKAMDIAREKGAQLSHAAETQGGGAPTAATPSVRATGSKGGRAERACKRAKPAAAATADEGGRGGQTVRKDEGSGREAVQAEAGCAAAAASPSQSSFLHHTASPDIREPPAQPHTAPAAAQAEAASTAPGAPPPIPPLPPSPKPEPRNSASASPAGTAAAAAAAAAAAEATAAPPPNTRSAYFTCHTGPHSNKSTHTTQHASHHPVTSAAATAAPTTDGAPAAVSHDMSKHSTCHNQSAGAPHQDLTQHCRRCSSPASRSSSPPAKSVCVASPTEGPPHRLRRSAPPSLPQQEQQQPSARSPSPCALGAGGCSSHAQPQHTHARCMPLSGSGSSGQTGQQQQHAAAAHASAADGAHSGGSQQLNQCGGPASAHTCVGEPERAYEHGPGLSQITQLPAVPRSGSRDLASLIRTKLYRPSARARASSPAAVQPQQQAQGHRQELAAG